MVNGVNLGWLRTGLAPSDTRRAPSATLAVDFPRQQEVMRRSYASPRLRSIFSISATSSSSLRII